MVHVVKQLVRVNCCLWLSRKVNGEKNSYKSQLVVKSFLGWYISGFGVSVWVTQR